MSARLVVVASVVLASGCALVSGLSNLEVGDASSNADGPSDAISDVTILPDTPPPPLEAGPGGYALSASGGCASGGTIDLSNKEFTLTLWLRVDKLPTNDTDVLPIVWNGGRGPSEQGWSLDLAKSGVVLCVSDQNGFTCSTPASITVGHLVHIGAVSPYNGQTSGRSMAVYAMDLSAGATTHTQLGSASGAQGNWSSSAPFTIGGAQVGLACVSPSTVTVDRIHLHTSPLSVGELDQTATTNVCTTAGTLLDYELDEDAGTAAKSCLSAQSVSWTAGSKIGFVISPFP